MLKYIIKKIKIHWGVLFTFTNGLNNIEQNYYNFVVKRIEQLCI